jgi:hypothetical protein
LPDHQILLRGPDVPEAQDQDLYKNKEVYPMGAPVRTKHQRIVHTIKQGLKNTRPKINKAELDAIIDSHIDTEQLAVQSHYQKEMSADDPRARRAMEQTEEESKEEDMFMRQVPIPPHLDPYFSSAYLLGDNPSERVLNAWAISQMEMERHVGERHPQISLFRRRRAFRLLRNRQNVARNGLPAARQGNRDLQQVQRRLQFGGGD